MVQTNASIAEICASDVDSTVSGGLTNPVYHFRSFVELLLLGTRTTLFSTVSLIITFIGCSFYITVRHKCVFFLYRVASFHVDRQNRKVHTLR